AQPTGTITYTIGSGTSQSAVIASGSATLTIPTSQASGTYAIALNYAGDGNYNAATGSVSLMVNQQATTITLASSATTITLGQPVTFVATVAPAAGGSPSGTVSFYDGATLLATSTISGGIATYSTSTLAPGVTHVISARFSGDANYLGANAVSNVSVTVAPLDFTLTGTGITHQTV